MIKFSIFFMFLVISIFNAKLCSSKIGSTSSAKVSLWDAGLYWVRKKFEIKGTFN